MEDSPSRQPKVTKQDESFRLLIPKPPLAPVIFTSSHSGRSYGTHLLSCVQLGTVGLRRSEDSFVDELFDAASDHGAPLLAATFPRALCDPNREPWELDPAMFVEPLPTWVNSTSARVTGGLGTIAKVVASGEAIYGRKLAFAEAERRIQAYWRPFHDALMGLIDKIKSRFGYCWVIDCHSMPSSGQFREHEANSIDFVLGDLHGTSCSPRATRFVESFLVAEGFAVRRNDPYAGGFITAHYGRPPDHVHVLQMEISRRLYMDEIQIERLAAFSALKQRLSELIGALTQEARKVLIN